MTSKLTRTALLFFLACICASAGLAQNFTTSLFQVNAEIRKNRTLRVQETIDVTFTRASHGILRWVPVDYLSKSGYRRKVDLKLIGVTQQEVGRGSTHRATVQQTIESGWWKLRIGDGNIDLDGRVRYVITYEIQGALTDFAETATSKAHTELNWHLLPTNWATSINSASVELRFPSGGKIPPRVRYLVGKIGSKDSVEIVAPGKSPEGLTDLLSTTLEVDDTTVHVKGGLEARNGVLVELAVDKGVVDWEGPYVPKVADPNARPETFGDESGQSVGAGEPMSAADENLWSPLGLIPFFVLITLTVVFRRLLGVPKQGPLVTKFEPPAGIGPIEAGYLIDGSFQPRDLTAGVISLAQKGAIRIILPAANADPDEKAHKIEILDTPLKEALTPSEQRLFDSLSPYGPVIIPNNLNTGNRSVYESVHRAVQNEAIQSQFMRRNHGCVQGCGCFSTMLLTGLLAAFCIKLGLAWTILGSLVGMSFLAISFLSSSGYTPEGARVQHELKGLREFISRAQSSELKAMTDKMPLQVLFESLLPYAVAFGFAQQWAEAFRGLSLTAPDWIEAGPSYSYDTFVWSNVIVDTISTFENEWTPALTPAPLFDNKGFSSNSSWGDGGGDSFASGGSSFSDFGSDSSSGGSDGGSVGDGGGGGGGDSW